MKRSSYNRLSNVRNPYQGDAKRVLCVCSAGLLRSPTLAEVLVKEYGHNTRACGSSSEYALIPIDDALIRWADQIVFVNEENYEQAKFHYKDDLANKEVIVLDIEDSFPFRDARLQAALKASYDEKVKQCESEDTNSESQDQ